MSYMVVSRDEGTFEPITDMLSREKSTSPLTWGGSYDFTLLDFF